MVKIKRKAMTGWLAALALTSSLLPWISATEAQIVYQDMIDAYVQGQLVDARALAQGHLKQVKTALDTANSDLSREGAVGRALGVIDAITRAENKLPAPTRLGGDLKLHSLVKGMVIQARSVNRQLQATPAVKKYIRRGIGRVAVGCIRAGEQLVDRRGLEAFYRDFQPEIKASGIADFQADARPTGKAPLVSTSLAPAPFPEETARVNRLIEQARSPTTKPEAIVKLKALVQNSNKDAFVKGYALERMVGLRQAELGQYFMDVAANRFGTDNNRRLREPAYLAFWRSQVDSEVDPHKQLGLLAQGLSATFEGLVAGHVQTWAARELCNRGAQTLLPAITESIKNRDPFARGTQDVKFCEIQIDLLSKFPTRLQALAGALATDDAFEDLRLYKWAVRELGKIRSEEALDVLGDFALKLQQTRGDALLRALTIQQLLDHGWSTKKLKTHGIKVVRMLD